MTKAEQELIDRMKKQEVDCWKPIHDKQRCHDLAKEAEEQIIRNKKQQEQKK